ncbi:receptor-like protein kinase HSL1, partial [Trifolium pratense]
PLIKGFAYCKPIVQVDGTWLYGKYKGTLLLAVAQDGNDHIFPVAFAIVEDRHPSIKSAYDNPENGWNDPTCRHVYCIRHIAQNFMRQFKDKKLRKLVVNTVNQPLHRYYRNKIAAQNTNAIGWLDNIPIAKWTQAFDEGRRWGHMTTNLAESMNNVFKGIRNEPITALVQSTFYKCVVLFQRRATESAAVLQSGQQYSEACQKRIEEAMHKANSHQVIAFDRLNQTFRVMETVNHNEGRPMGRFLLKLGESCCDCGEFQALHLPCSHVIAACSHAAQA